MNKINKSLSILVFLIVLSSCANESAISLEGELVNDSDFIGLIQIDEMMKKNILDGTYDTYKDEINKVYNANNRPEICDAITIAKENNYSRGLVNYFEIKCLKKGYLLRFKQKFPEYYELPFKDRLAIKNRVAEKANVKAIQADEALELFINRNRN